MDIIIFIILAALGSIIFKDKKKGPSQSDQGSTSGQRSQPMTWEEMERQYGITIEHDTDHTEKQTQPAQTVQPNVETKDHVEWERQAALIAAADKVKLPAPSKSLEETRLGSEKNYKSSQVLREGMRWSIILETPKALQHRSIR